MAVVESLGWDRDLAGRSHQLEAWAEDQKSPEVELELHRDRSWTEESAEGGSFQIHLAGDLAVASLAVRPAAFLGEAC